MNMIGDMLAEVSCEAAAMGDRDHIRSASENPGIRDFPVFSIKSDRPARQVVASCIRETPMDSARKAVHPTALMPTF